MISLNFTVIPGNLTNLGPFINSWSITYQTNIFIFGSVSKSCIDSYLCLIKEGYRPNETLHYRAEQSEMNDL